MRYLTWFLISIHDVWLHLVDACRKETRGKTGAEVPSKAEIIRKYNLTVVSDDDRQALQAAAKLAQIASEVLPATGTNGASEPSAAALSNEQLRQLAQLLARKVWVRRQELGATSRRLTSVLLDQTAQRVLQGRQTT